jgi:hypothetical protein
VGSAAIRDASRPGRHHRTDPCSAEAVLKHPVCPCGSNQAYADCCGLFLDEGISAPTASMAAPIDCTKSVVLCARMVAGFISTGTSGSRLQNDPLSSPHRPRLQFSGVHLRIGGANGGIWGYICNDPMHVYVTKQKNAAPCSST